MHFRFVEIQKIILADDCQEESVIVMKFLLLQAEHWMFNVNPYDVKGNSYNIITLHIMVVFFFWMVMF